MNDPVLSALVEMVVSIQLADEESIDLDFAVSLSEQAAHALAGLSPERSREFKTIVDELALRATTQERADAIRGVPEALGLLVS